MISQTNSRESDERTRARVRFWPRELLLGLMPLLIGFELLACTAYLPVALRGGADFRQLDAGGYIIRTGQRSKLYDYQTQREIEEKLAPLGASVALPVNHLAYEELLFVPLSVLPYRQAFLVFLTVNLAVLAFCVRLLRPSLTPLAIRWKPLPMLIFAAFHPIIRTLLQGQDSILLLALLIGAWAYLQEKEDFSAGLLVGLGLFKFQIALPIGLLFLLWRRWRFAIGFAVSASLAVAASFIIVGRIGVRQYMSMLVSMSLNLKPGTDAVFHYATNPYEMLNIRGLVSAFFASRVTHSWTQGITFGCSLVLLILAARLRPSLPAAITAASLVSYHFVAHDASVLMIPMALALCSESLWMILAATALLIAPITALLPTYGYIAAIPIFVLFFAYFMGSPYDSTTGPRPV